MSKEPCGICGGRQVITLPIRRSATYDQGEMVALPAKKEFPCPECGPVVSEARVAILGSSAKISREMEELRNIPHQVFHRQIAEDMVHVLLKDGYIRFEERADAPDRYVIEGRLGVVSPSVVASLEERIAERQFQVAEEAIDRFYELIGQWGAGAIAKGYAKQLAAQALEEAKKRRVR